MKELKEPVPALFLCGLLFNDHDVFRQATRVLEEKFGKVRTFSPEWPFYHTDYYAREMGSGLKRIFLLFSRLMPQDCLVHAKHACREIEEQFLKNGARTINIDPGILTPERLVLATSKNFTHRIYLGQGVFAEITLMATRSGFRTLEWTFPDYASPEILSFWNKSRRDYLARLKQEGMI